MAANRRDRSAESLKVQAREFLRGAVARPITVVKSTPHTVLRGVIALPGQFVPAHVKLLPEAMRDIEAVCAWLAMQLELPVPRPALVEVLRSRLPLNCGWPFGDRNRATCFASQSLPTALALRGGVSTGRTIDELLIEWPLLARAAVFDHLIANDDRNDGNLLVQPDGSLWLIDHARALGGAGDRLFSDAFPNFNNALLTRLAALPAHERQRRRREVLSACVDAISASQRVPFAILGVADVNAQGIERFLKRRADRLVTMVTSIVGLPEIPFSGNAGSTVSQ